MFGINSTHNYWLEYIFVSTLKLTSTLELHNREPNSFDECIAEHTQHMKGIENCVPIINIKKTVI